MFKANITVHCSPKGKLTVKACTSTATEALAAYRSCTEPGQIQLYHNGQMQKHKKIPAPPKTKNQKPAATEK